MSDFKEFKVTTVNGSKMTQREWIDLILTFTKRLPKGASEMQAVMSVETATRELSWFRT